MGGNGGHVILATTQPAEPVTTASNQSIPRPTMHSGKAVVVTISVEPELENPTMGG
jgi:hypothetical protein